MQGFPEVDTIRLVMMLNFTATTEWFKNCGVYSEDLQDDAMLRLLMLSTFTTTTGWIKNMQHLESVKTNFKCTGTSNFHRDYTRGLIKIFCS